MTRTPFVSPRHATGFSLVELMVALTIGVFLLGGLSTLLFYNSQARTEMEKSAEQIENGRYALDVLAADLQMAGFYSEFAPRDVQFGTADNCATSGMGFNAGTSPVTFPMPVYGYPVGGSVSPTTSCLDNMVPNSEVLVIRRVSSTTVTTPASGEYYLQGTACALATQSYVYDTLAANFTLKTRDCVTAVPLRKFIVHVYYLSSCDDCSGAGDGIPTLKMAEFSQGTMKTVPLTQGIQDIHYEYGIDMDGNGAVDCYVADPNLDNSASCPTVSPVYSWSNALTNWSNVASVRVNLLARNTNKTNDWTDTRKYDLGRLDGSNAIVYSGPFNDQYKRHAYSAVARLWNLGGARETP